MVLYIVNAYILSLLDHDSIVWLGLWSLLLALELW